MSAADDISVPVLRPLLPSAERLQPYLHRIDATRIYSNHGPLVAELEGRLYDHLRLPRGAIVTAASGTAALVGAILASAGRAAPARPLALLPAFTFVATAAAVEQCGYRPYLVDIDAASWMLDPRGLAQHHELGRVGLVVPVAPFGRPVPEAPWRAFARSAGIPVVIDGAASFEGIEGDPERFVGEVPVALSFHATKSFATGEGGAVVTTDGELAEKIVRAVNFGFYGSRDSRSPGFNGKMSEYHAAIGLAELDAWREKRAAMHAVAACYRRCFERAGLGRACIVAPEIASCYALFRCAGAIEAGRAEAALHRGHIDFRRWYGEGVHRHAAYAGLPHDDLVVTEALAPCLLGLPVAPDLSDRSISRIVAALAAATRPAPGANIAAG